MGDWRDVFPLKLLHYFQVVYVERQLSRELTHYQADIYDQVVVTGWNEESRSVRILDAGHPRKNLRVVLLPGRNVPLVSRIAKYPVIYGIDALFDKVPFDILHLNTHLNIQSHFIAQKAKRRGCVVFLTIHGLIGYYNSILNSVQRMYLRILSRTLFRSVNHLICLTESDMAELAALGVQKDKMTVIPNGVNEDFFTPMLESPDKSVIWHGRFIPQKGLIDFIKMSKSVLEILPETHFIMMGWGPQEQLIRRLVVQLGLAESFHFLGKQPWVQVPKNLARAQVYAMPSYREGMPYSLLESMACGTPAVAYSIPGISDVVEHGVDGYLVDLGNHDLMAEMIVNLLSNRKKRHHMGRMARQKIEDSYSWSSIASRMDTVYQLVLEEKRCSSI